MSIRLKVVVGCDVTGCERKTDATALGISKMTQYGEGASLSLTELQISDVGWTVKYLSFTREAIGVLCPDHSTGIKK